MEHQLTVGQPQQPNIHVVGDSKEKEGEEKTFEGIMAGNFSKFDENHKHPHPRNSKISSTEKSILTIRCKLI